MVPKNMYIRTEPILLDFLMFINQFNSFFLGLFEIFSSISGFFTVGQRLSLFFCGGGTFCIQTSNFCFPNIALFLFFIIIPISSVSRGRVVVFSVYSITPNFFFVGM